MREGATPMEESFAKYSATKEAGDKKAQEAAGKVAAELNAEEQAKIADQARESMAQKAEDAHLAEKYSEFLEEEKAVGTPNPEEATQKRLKDLKETRAYIEELGKIDKAA